MTTLVKGLDLHTATTLAKKWLPLGILIAFVALFFYKLAFTDLILARGDTFTFFYPYWDARSEAFRQLQLPLWSPELFMGSPLLAEPQLGTFYPPNWLVTPFSVPDAMRYSVLLHVLWAASGMYLLYRRHSNKHVRVPAIVAALIFAFSGFVTAHVEQINQLQGIAWMPWIVLLWARIIVPIGTPRGMSVFLAINKRTVQSLLLFSMALAMQFFSGHTQTVFITGVGLLIYTLGTLVSRGLNAHARLSLLLTAGVALAIAGIVTLLLVLPQFLPTLELTGMSNRGGSGFNPAQASAFSLPPHYLPRALLPSYDGLLFGEYIAGIGVIGLALMLMGMLAPSHQVQTTRWRWIWVAFVVVGVLLAFGRYNPLYYDGLAHLPGFNLFRVPARWMALFTLGAAMLTGQGAEHLLDATRRYKRALIPAMLLVAVMAMALLLPRLSDALNILPEDVINGAQLTSITLLAWGMGLLVYLLIVGVRRLPSWVIVAVITVELWGASQVMTFNDLAPEEVYTGQRFSISQLLADQQESVVPPRVLSITRLAFDVGDREALRARYEALGMSEDAIQTAFTALKRQETLAANLPLKWHIQSADGYGGGILPTMYYSQFTSLLLPVGAMRSADGRLGEAMAQERCLGACIPASTYMTRAGISHLITDKVFDQWIEGVYYDTTIWRDARTWTSLSRFVADEIRVMFEGSSTFSVLVNGEKRLLDTITPIDDTLSLGSIQWDALQNPDDWQIVTPEETQIVAITLVNTRTGTFVALAPELAPRVLSSDIKMYQFGNVRAYLAPLATVQSDSWSGSEEALVSLRDEPLFDTLQLPDDAPMPIPVATNAAVEITEYTPTRVVLRVENVEEANYLILSDAWYPIWQATVNGEATPVYRANVMFRAVHVPVGDSEIVFTFVPTLWYVSLAVGVVAWVIVAIVWWLVRKD